MKRFIFAAAWMFAAAISFGAAPAPHIPTTGVRDARAVNFADPLSVIELRPSLSPYHAAVPDENDGSTWYMMTAVNNSAAPETRVLQAGESPRASLRLFPASTRPQLVQVASSDADVSVLGSSDYARHTFRVTIPPATSVALAIRLQNVADVPPSVLAWNEGALASQYRQLAIFMSVVAGLIGAAALIIAGLAIMTGHAAPRWAALALFALLFTRLSATGMFDTSLATSVGGPYGLSAFFAGLALAAGIKMIDVIAPFAEQWPGTERYLTWSLYGLAILSLLSYLGIPGATVLVEIVILFGSSAISAYLVHRGRMGFRPARVIAPSATVFALVALATAATSVGVFGDNAAASAVVGGFAAAGTVLLALAIVAGEGIVIVPHWRLPGQHPAPRPEPAAAAAQSAQPSSQTAAALAAIGASHQGVFDLDIKKGIVTLSADAANLIGYKDKQQQFQHAAWIARIHPEDREVYQQAVEDFSAHTGLAFRIEFRVKSEGGRYPWFELRATMLGESPPASRCLGLMADVTTRKEAENAAGEPAHAAPPERSLRDALTGLGNRLSLMEDLERADFSNAVFALLDIDRFKSIHASLGDAAADALLVKIGERLSARFERRAQIFRIGGDSFAALFTSSRIAPSAAGADLMEACSSPYVSEGRTIFAPASVGVVQGSDARDPFELIKNAEIALSQAKRQGGGIVKVYGREMEHLATEDSVVLETELRRALDDHQLDVFYQPIVRLSDRTVAGFEALLRWHHPTKGLVVPADFIAHSEETGLIVSLGRFALETAAKELANWQRFFPLNPPLTVSVNLSRRQLRDSGFESDLRGVLSKQNIARGTLKLELTETAVSTETDTKTALENLRAAGATLVMDDFGTGLSNLSQFKDLPFDTLKIDRSFLTRHSGDEPNDATVLRSIVGLAHELGRAVVVEGVESEHDAAWVKELGCDYAQGFCFSQPLPAAEALNYLSMHFDEKTAVPASGAAGVGG